ncbi:hypothetical protein ALIPUT_00357 [Alistipes putredinis DSM 17216]|uniref:Uncharacterized protein n=1 Tax=Alistipes putredinis DSM 17216 TaxID=445970 RepID=B0MSX0_9BACT|nr:hypothetical protein ALIPUT_00357 [Alistipes putredinis DSM 17216]
MNKRPSDDGWNIEKYNNCLIGIPGDYVPESFRQVMYDGSHYRQNTALPTNHLPANRPIKAGSDTKSP